MLVSTTLLIAQYSFDPQFDDREAFQLIYQNDTAHPLNIAAAPAVNWGLVPGGGFTPSAPAATVFQGNLALFVRGGDDRLYVNWLLPITSGPIGALCQVVGLSLQPQRPLFSTTILPSSGGEKITNSTSTLT